MLLFAVVMMVVVHGVVVVVFIVIISWKPFLLYRGNQICAAGTQKVESSPGLDLVKIFKYHFIISDDSSLKQSLYPQLFAPPGAFFLHYYFQTILNSWRYSFSDVVFPISTVTQSRWLTPAMEILGEAFQPPTSMGERWIMISIFCISSSFINHTETWISG